MLSVFKAFLLYSLFCIPIPTLQLSTQTTTAAPVSKEQWGPRLLSQTTCPFCRFIHLGPIANKHAQPLWYAGHQLPNFLATRLTH